jgi:FkbM family methyltransferase
MKTFPQAVRLFVQNPQRGYQKVFPYLKARFSRARRHVAEWLGISYYSKPYTDQDKLVRLLKTQRNGFFVVCGGNDGFAFDPTYYLEKFLGWRGLIIEPLPDAALECRRNRPDSIVIETALVDHSYQDPTISLYDCNFMSVTSQTNYDINHWVELGKQAQQLVVTERIVPATTLDHILSTQPTLPAIDLLVIDVEGSEHAILSGITFSTWLPKHILVELHTEDLKQKVFALLAPHYNFVSSVDSADYFFTARSTPLS